MFRAFSPAVAMDQRCGSFYYYLGTPEFMVIIFCSQELILIPPKTNAPLRCRSSLARNPFDSFRWDAFRRLSRRLKPLQLQCTHHWPRGPARETGEGSDGRWFVLIFTFACRIPLPAAVIWKRYFMPPLKAFSGSSSTRSLHFGSKCARNGDESNGSGGERASPLADSKDAAHDDC